MLVLKRSRIDVPSTSLSATMEDDTTHDRKRQDEEINARQSMNEMLPVELIHTILSWCNDHALLCRFVCLLWKELIPLPVKIKRASTARVAQFLIL